VGQLEAAPLQHRFFTKKIRPRASRVRLAFGRKRLFRFRARASFSLPASRGPFANATIAPEERAGPLFGAGKKTRLSHRGLISQIEHQMLWPGRPLQAQVAALRHVSRPPHAEGHFFRKPWGGGRQRPKMRQSCFFPSWEPCLRLPVTTVFCRCVFRISPRCPTAPVGGNAPPPPRRDRGAGDGPGSPFALRKR